MSDSNSHFLLVVKAPGINLTPLRSGGWVIVANNADVEALEAQRAACVYALAAYRGEVAIMRLELDKPEESMIVWSHHMEEVPAVASLMTPTDSQREAFWTYANHRYQQYQMLHEPRQAGPAAGEAQEPAHGKLSNRTQWWLAGAAIAMSLLAYAVFPEIFQGFNWQGRLYDTAPMSQLR